MLSAEASARAFINGTVRPLESALLDFHFAHGSREAVIAEVAKFQKKPGSAQSPEYLSAAPLRMEMPDIEMSIELSIELVRCLPHDRSNATLRKLKSVLDAVMVRNPQPWISYNLKPLTFIHTLESPYYAGLENEVAAELDYLVATQLADGGWALTWSWENSDPAAWEIAKNRPLTTSGSLRGPEGLGRGDELDRHLGDERPQPGRAVLHPGLLGGYVAKMTSAFGRPSAAASAPYSMVSHSRPSPMTRTCTSSRWRVCRSVGKPG